MKYSIVINFYPVAKIFFEKTRSMTIVNKIFLFFLFLLVHSFSNAQEDYRMTEYENETVRTFMDAGRERILQNYEQAVVLYKEVLKKDRKNPAAAYELARVYDVLDKNDEALDLITKAVSWDGENIWYRLFLADMYDKLGRYKDGIKTLEVLVAKHPKDAYYYNQLTYFYTKANQPAKAIEVLNKLESIEGLSEEIVRKKHTLYIGIGDNDKAAQELEKLVKFYPDEVSYAYLLAGFYTQINQVDKAKQVYHQILQRFPDEGKAKLALANIEKSKGGDSSSLVSTLSSVFEDPETHIDTKIKAILPLVEKVDMKSDPKFLADMLHLADILTKVHPDEAKSFAVKGDILYNSGDSKAALTSYKKAIDLGAKVYPVWSQAMNIALQIGLIDDLMSISSKALDYFPNKPEAYFMNGIANSQKGNHKEALSIFQQVKLMTRKNPSFQAKALAYISSEYFFLNKKEKGMKFLKEAEALDGNNPAILEQLGDAFLIMGDKAKSKKYWQSALDKGGNVERLKKKLGE